MSIQPIKPYGSGPLSSVDTSSASSDTSKAKAKSGDKTFSRGIQQSTASAVVAHVAGLISGGKFPQAIESLSGPIDGRLPNGDNLLHVLARVPWNSPHASTLAQLLIEKGVQINARSGDGETPLAAAAGAKNPQAVLWFALHNAALQAPSTSRAYVWTPV